MVTVPSWTLRYVRSFHGIEQTAHALNHDPAGQLGGVSYSHNHVDFLVSSSANIGMDLLSRGREYGGLMLWSHPPVTIASVLLAQLACTMPPDPQTAYSTTYNLVLLTELAGPAGP